MEALKHTVYGTLRFSFTYILTDAELREHPYSKGVQWRPVSLSFTLVSDAEGKGHPRYKDLRTQAIDLHGYRIKKDGTMGLQEVNEHLYYRSDHPAWALEIISAAAAELKENAPGNNFTLPANYNGEA